MPSTAQPARSPGLAEVIRGHAADPERLALVFPVAGVEERITYADLWERAGRFAAALAARGVRRGHRVAIGMVSRWEVVVGVIAVQRLGCTLIPLQDVPAPRQSAAKEAIVLAALRAGQAAWCVVPASSVPAYEVTVSEACLAAQVLPLEELATYEAAEGAPEFVPMNADEPLLIQFSSGSTAQPKGVCLTAGNVASHVEAVTRVLRGSVTDTIVSWLPLYHDMGLIGALFTSLWAGATTVLMRPQDFVRNPLAWIEALGRHRATITMAPQFAYSLCVARSQGANAWEKLQATDLSTLRVALNGSETVHWELSRAFAERFAALGLHANALQPAYGLAENCVAVTLRTPLSAVPSRRLSRTALAEGIVMAAGDDEGDDAVQTTVGNGTPIHGTRVSIRDDEGRELGPGAVGQIHFAGTSATAEYAVGEGERPSASTDGWVPTGDLGAVIDGELHVIGRIKEIIKSGGRTFVPSDIEAALATRLADQLAGAAVFGCYDAVGGAEQVVVVAEAGRAARGDAADELPGRIRLAVLQEFQLPVHDVVIVRARTIPRTSSGKIQRVRIRDAYARGELHALAEA
jgi:acyl-CoA synthetase (AMP-forming)/AMP-acid ligase II